MTHEIGNQPSFAARTRPCCAARRGFEIAVVGGTRVVGVDSRIAVEGTRVAAVGTRVAVVGSHVVVVGSRVVAVGSLQGIVDALFFL